MRLEPDHGIRSGHVAHDLADDRVAPHRLGETVVIDPVHRVALISDARDPAHRQLHNALLPQVHVNVACRPAAVVRLRRREAQEGIPRLQRAGLELGLYRALLQISEESLELQEVGQIHVFIAVVVKRAKAI